MRTLKIANADVWDAVGATPPALPKYVGQLLNLANQNAGGTRPKVVGQMSELVQACPGRTLAEWETWYREKHRRRSRMPFDGSRPCSRTSSARWRSSTGA